MKKVWTCLLILAFLNANGQDEFGSTAFYSDLKKILSDAQQGFSKFKGEKRSAEFEELNDEYRVKFLLPLADSGKIVVPNIGTPFVTYYFEPNRNRLKVDQRAMSLRDAIVTVYEKPLYLKSETVILNNRPFTNTWLFRSPEETKNSEALFHIMIYYDEKQYFLSLDIRSMNL